MTLHFKKAFSLLAVSFILYGCTANGVPTPYNINVSFPVITQNSINSDSYYSDDIEYIRTEDGLCLTASPDHRNQLTLQKCGHPGYQRFTVHRDRITHNGKCLDAAGQETREGTPVILYSCTGNDNQRWFTDDNKIHGKQSNKCLGTKSFIVRKGDSVVLADCDFSRALEFTKG
ncbi:ricin-type beta-trefoil lectin domain protein [Salmonella enterica]|nr:lipoprotein EnvE [Salmonella enterica]ECD7240553.1 lipoprotein EnvE [Salmonella enterica subsp. enterica serovar Florida]ECW9753706.1 ricin-type beta-trefoil lectin domain protein [Salmonella enterica subsp. enterica serovar Newport]ECF4164741.1 lipoprotein EnvE [Salmonella enterica subsp. enterica serovar Florida]ECW2472573.1 lipoprotein EnvE [Salmonella enterica subsp. enterica serovar Florida]